MKHKARVFLELPSDTDIEATEETRMQDDPTIIKRTIRYKNGIVAVLVQDFQNMVFSIEIRSPNAPFWISQNQVFRMKEPK